jgi:phage terminase Nu1 subunit (DNA packaging protein)
MTELEQQRQRLYKLRADAQELKNEQLRGDLIAVADVERKWTENVRRIRSALLALPSRVAHQLPHLTQEDRALVEREVRAVLAELAEGYGH